MRPSQMRLEGIKPQDKNRSLHATSHGSSNNNNTAVRKININAIGKCQQSVVGWKIHFYVTLALFYFKFM
jgi:hypothetical protein